MSRNRYQLISKDRIGTAIFSAGQVMAGLLNLGVGVLVARKLGPDGAGQWNFLLWLITTTVALAAANAPNTASSFVAKFNAEKSSERAFQAASSLAFKVTGFSLATGLILTLFALDSKQFGSTLVAIAIGAVIPLWAIGNVGAGVLIGERQFSRVFFFHVVPALVYFVTTVIVLQLNPRPGALVATLVCSNLAALGLVWSRTWVGRARVVDIEAQTRVSRYLVSSSGVVLVGLVVWDKSEVVFLKIFSPLSEIAFYSISFSFVTSVMRVIPGAIVAILLPKLSSLTSGKSRNSFSVALSRSFSIVVLIATSLTYLGALLGPYFIVRIYGQSYSPMIPVFLILLASSVFSVLANVLITAYLSLEYVKYVLIVTGSAGLFNLLLDVVLVFTLDAVGAAVANLLTQMAALFVLAWSIHAKVGIALDRILLWKSVRVSFLCCALSTLPALLIGGPAGAIVGCLVFMPLLFTAVTRSDLSNLLGIRRPQTHEISAE